METEVAAKALRRRFTAAEKLQVLREADRCRGAGDLRDLLRREGLTSSHLSAWLAARRRGELAASQSRVLRPRRKRPDARDRRILELERENQRLKASAQALVEVQERVSQLLRIPLERDAKG